MINTLENIVAPPVEVNFNLTIGGEQKKLLMRFNQMTIGTMAALKRIYGENKLDQLFKGTLDIELACRILLHHCPVEDIKKLEELLDGVVKGYDFEKKEEIDMLPNPELKLAHLFGMNDELFNQVIIETTQGMTSKKKAPAQDTLKQTGP